MPPLSVAILYYSGTHDDDEDTLLGVKGVAQSLRRTGHPVKQVIVTADNWQEAVKTPGDVVFNFVEDDTWELYEKVGRKLERLGRPQVGHDLKGFRYAIRKSPIKTRMKRMRINTPNFKIFTRTQTGIDPGNLTFPLIIKPSNQHAGIGISQKSVVTNAGELASQVASILREYPGEVIAEEFVSGREIHVTVIGNGKRLTVLPYCEIGFKGKFKKHWNVYTYEAKWVKKTWEYDDARIKAPAKIPEKLAKRIRSLVIASYRAFQCRDIARFDIRVSEKGTPYLIDVNMNPSINYYDEQDATLASVYALGWTYDQFIENLISIAYRRLHPAQEKDKRLRK